MTLVRRKDFELTWEGIGETVSSWFRPQVRYGGSGGCDGGDDGGVDGNGHDDKGSAACTWRLYAIPCACLFSNKPSLAV